MGRMAIIKREDVPINLLTTHQLKLRPLDEDVISGIASSFKAKGQEQDILVRRLDDGTLRVVYGEHRLAAARAAGYSTIRCRIEAMSDEEELERKVAENIHRNTRINPVVEGQIFERLMSTKYRSANELADAIGKPPGYIMDRITVWRGLDKSLHEKVGFGLSVGNAIAIAKLSTKEEQKLVAEAIMSHNKKEFKIERQKNEVKQRVECVCSACGYVHDKRQ